MNAFFGILYRYWGLRSANRLHWLCLLVVLCVSPNLRAATYYNISGADVSSTTSWGLNTNGSGSHPGGFSTPGDVFELVNGTTATFGANWTMQNTTLTVGNGSSAINFTVPAGFSLTNSTGSVVNVTASATVTIKNLSVIPVFGTMSATSTVIYNGASSQPIASASYGNLTISNGSANSASGNITVNNVLSLSGSSILNFANYILTLNGTVTGMNSSNYLISDFNSNFIIGSSGATGTIYIDAESFGLDNFTISSSGGSVAVGTLSSESIPGILLYGALTVGTGATLDLGTNKLVDESGGLSVYSMNGTLKTAWTVDDIPVPSGKTWGGSVVYDGSLSQTIMAGTYNNLTISNGSYSPMSGTITVNGELSLTGNTVLECLDKTLNLNGTVNMNATNCLHTDLGAILNIGATGTVGAIYFTGIFSDLGKLTVTGSGGNVVIGSGINLDDSLVVVPGATLDMGINPLHDGGGLSCAMNGTFKTACNSAFYDPVPFLKTWGGTFIYNCDTAIYYLYGGNMYQTIMSGTYNNLTISNGFYDPMSGDITVNGELSLTGNTVLECLDQTLNLNGTVNMTASNCLHTDLGTILNIGATGTVGAIYFTGILSDLGKLTVTGSGENVVIGSGINLDDSLVVLSGATLDMGINPLTDASGGTSVYAMNGTFKTACNSAFYNPVPSLKTWGGTFIYDCDTALYYLYGGELNQSIMQGTYNNLKVSNGFYSPMSGTITVNGELSLSGNTKLDCHGKTLNLNGTVNMDANNCLYSVLFANLNIGATGTVGTIYFSGYAGELGNLAMTGSGGYAVMGTGINLHDSLIVVPGATLDMSTNELRGISCAMNGTLKTECVNPLFYPPLPILETWGGTVIYDGDSSQTIVEGTYNNLTLSNASINYLLNSGYLPYNITVNGTLTLSGSTQLDLNYDTLTLNGAVTGMDASDYFTGDSAAVMIVGTTGTLGNLFFDQTTPGTSNHLHNFTINGTGSTTTLGNALSIGDTLALIAGTINDGGNIITNAGNITGTGTETGTGKIVMTGSGTSISGATLGNIELNNSGVFNLTGSATINGTLTLAAGSLKIGTYDLTLGSSAGAIAGSLSAANMIVADNTGILYKQFTGAATYLFPLGDSDGNYSPATLTFGSGTYTGAAAGVHVTHAKLPENANTTNYLNRYWTVTSSGTMPSYSISSTYTMGDISGTESGIAAGQYTGSLPFVKFGLANTSTHTLAAAGITATLSDFTGINNTAPSVSVLPASAAICAGSSALLDASGTGDPTLTYVWTPAPGLAATNTSAVSASPTVATTYTVTVTDGNGFSGATAVTVTVNPLPAAISGSTIVGENDSITLSDAGGGAWSSASAHVLVGTGTGVITGVVTGSAVISYTLATGCAATTTVAINPVPIISIQPASQAGCLGYRSAFSVSAAPGETGELLSYQWLRNGIAISGATQQIYTIDAVAAADTGTGIYSCLLSEYGDSTYTYSEAASLILNKGAVFTGGTGNWATPGNWTTGIVPDSTTHVYIPASTPFMPEADGGAIACKCLTLEAGASLTLNGATLAIAGAINNSGGLINAGNGSILLNGSSVSQTLPAGSFTANSVENLTIDNNAGVTLGGDLTVTGTYTPTAGVLNTGGYLTLASTSTGTANVAQGSPSGGYISGDVTVERYINENSNRAWRLLATNTTGSQTIKSAWQEGASAMANPNPGYGTLITCDNSYSTAAGFDAVTYGMSILAFDVTAQNWTSNAVSNTDSKVWSSEPGYFLYVRGDRSIDTSSAITGASATILRSSGSLLTGDQPAVPVPAGGYALIGNPFPSAIDFSLINAADIPNIGNRFWLWDPKLSGSYGVGAYVLFDASTVIPWTPSVTGGSYNAPNSIIQSGMAFFVEGGSMAGSCTIREEIKTTNNDNNGFRTAGTATAQLNVSLSVVKPDGTQAAADGVFALFNDSFSAGIDAGDALKLPNTGENLAISSQGSTLALDARPPLTGDDTLFLSTWNLNNLHYRITITPAGTFAPDLSAFLYDGYLNTFTPVDLNKPSTYDFSVTNVAASQAKNRFYITSYLVDPTLATVPDNITVFPNPTTKSDINAVISKMAPGVFQFHLFNTAGQQVVTDAVFYPGGEFSEKLPATNVAPGMYELVIDQNGMYYKTIKITIK